MLSSCCCLPTCYHLGGGLESEAEGEESRWRIGEGVYIGKAWNLAFIIFRTFSGCQPASACAVILAAAASSSWRMCTSWRKYGVVRAVHLLRRYIDGCS